MQGDILYVGASGWARFPSGVAGQVMTCGGPGADPSWSTQTGANPIAAWPIGSVFLSVVSTDPAVLLGGGVWTQIASGRMLVGQNGGDTDFDAAEEVGGAKTSSALLAHTHGIDDLGHTHIQDAHTHVQETHTHVQNAHTHLQDIHGHTQNAHTHVQDAHTHVQSAHTHVQDAHTHIQNSHNHTQNPHNHVISGGSSDDTSAPFTGPDASTSIATAFGGGIGNTTAVNQAATAVNQNATAVNQNATATNQNATAVNQNAVATNQDTTAVNQNATATNQNATAINQNATAVNQAASTGISVQSSGSGASFSLMNPYFVVFIWKRTA